MSRSGPEYVESEAQLHRDLEQKQEHGDISAGAANAFRDLYEFACELGDDIEIGDAKNANFRMYVDAHQGTYENDPSVFSANVTGLVKIWPAKKPVSADASDAAVGWKLDDFTAFKREFQSLRGVSQGDQEVRFESMVEDGTLDQFETIVAQFVATCREQADNSSH